MFYVCSLPQRKELAGHYCTGKQQGGSSGVLVESCTLKRTCDLDLNRGYVSASRCESQLLSETSLHVLSFSYIILILFHLSFSQQDLAGWRRRLVTSSIHSQISLCVYVCKCILYVICIVSQGRVFHCLPHFGIMMFANKIHNSPLKYTHKH